MKTNIVDSHPMGRMSECRFGFGYCGRSFASPVMYRISSTKRVAMWGYVFCVSSHFFNAYTYAVHLPLPPSWLHQYILCIVSWIVTHRRKRLVDACPCHCKIVMVDSVILIHSMMKCVIWMVVLRRDC